MKKLNLILTTLFCLAIGLNSCEELGKEKTIEDLEGQWSVIEDALIKKKSTLDAFQVTIFINPEDSTQVIIENFNASSVGSIEGLVIANYTQGKLTLPSQTFANDMTVVSGTGIISSNYQEINWNYSIDDGSGIPVNFTATYTKDY